MEAVLEFENKLAEITMPMELRRDQEKMYNLMTVTELQDKAPFVCYQTYVGFLTVFLENKIIVDRLEAIF